MCHLYGCSRHFRSLALWLRVLFASVAFILVQEGTIVFEVSMAPGAAYSPDPIRLFTGTPVLRIQHTGGRHVAEL